MKVTKGPKRSGPSSAIGILNFFDTDMSGPKISPEFVLLVTIAFIIILFVLHMLG